MQQNCINALRKIVRNPFSVHHSKRQCAEMEKRKFQKSSKPFMNIMATIGDFGGDGKGGSQREGNDGGGADDSNREGTATGGDSVPLEFHPEAKPLGRETLKKEDMLAMIEARGLLDDRDWNVNDHHAIANILVGRSLDINPTNPADEPLMQLANRIGNEYERSGYFLQLLEPPCVIFHSLQMAPAAQNDEKETSKYMLGDTLIDWQTSNNDGILDNANRAILSAAGSAHSNIGMVGCAVTSPIPTDPLNIACRNAAERQQLVALIKQEMEMRVPGSAKKLPYTFVNTTIPINYNP